MIAGTELGCARATRGRWPRTWHRMKWVLQRGDKILGLSLTRDNTSRSEAHVHIIESKLWPDMHSSAWRRRRHRHSPRWRDCLGQHGRRPRADSYARTLSNERCAAIQGSEEVTVRLAATLYGQRGCVVVPRWGPHAYLDLVHSVRCCASAL